MSKALFRHFGGAANQQSAVRAALSIEPGTGDGRPATLLRDTGDGAGVTGKELIGGFLCRRRAVPQGAHADLQSIERVPRTRAGLPVEIDERPEAPWLAADDGHHQGQPQRTGANERLGSPADSPPYRQGVLHRSRVDALPCQGGPVLAGPADVLVVTDLQEQLQLLFEER